MAIYGMGLIKLFLLFSILSCEPQEPLSRRELTYEFEDIWWEAEDNPLIMPEDGVVCFIFVQEEDLQSGLDGRIWTWYEGEDFSGALTSFEKTSTGYYIPYYDVDLEILVDENGLLTMKGRQGIFSHSSLLKKCSLSS